MAFEIARHGPLNAAGLCYGHLDLVSTQSHQDVADAIIGSRALLSRRAPSCIVTSPLMRANGPATELASRFGLPLREEPAVMELHMGDWEGKPFADLESAPEFSHWMNNWQTAAPPNGEALPNFYKRVSQALHGLEDGTLVVAHAGVIRVAMVMLRGLSWDDAMNTKIGYATVHAF
jgi:alpha-ribazole phosphatase